MPTNKFKQMNQKYEIVICMGSACFSKGSKNIVEAVNEYFDNQLPENIFLKGSLCTGNCENGPVMIVNQQIYKELDKDKVFEILAKYKLK